MLRKDLQRGPTRDARAVEAKVLAVADDLSPLLDALGLRYRRGDGGRKLLAPCPSPDHPDRSPSWFMNNDPTSRHFGTHACSSCGYAGGPVALAATSEGGVETWEQAASLLVRLFVGSGGEVDGLLERALALRTRARVAPVDYDLAALGMVSAEGTPGADYLGERGLTSMERVGLGALWAPKGTLVRREGDASLDFGRRVVLPVVDGGSVVTFAARAVRRGVKPKYMYPPSPRETILWGTSLWDASGEDVGLTEGILDAWGVFRATGLPTFAAMGARLTPAQGARLRRSRSVTVFPDPNAAGDMLPEDAVKVLPNVPVFVAWGIPRGRDAGDSLRPEGDPSRLDPAVLLALLEAAEDARTPRRPVRTVRYGGALCDRRRRLE